MSPHPYLRLQQHLPRQETKHTLTYVQGNGESDGRPQRVATSHPLEETGTGTEEALAHPAPLPPARELVPGSHALPHALPRAWPNPPLRSKTASQVLAAIGLTNSTNYTWTDQSHRLDPRPYRGWSSLPRHRQTWASYLNQLQPPQTLTDLGLIPEPAPASSDTDRPRPHTCTGPASSDTNRPGPHTCTGPASSDTDRAESFTCTGPASSDTDRPGPHT